MKSNNTERIVLCAALAGLGMSDDNWVENLKKNLTDDMIIEFENLCRAIDSVDEDDFENELMQLFIKNLKGEIYVG